MENDICLYVYMYVRILICYSTGTDEINHKCYDEFFWTLY